MNQEAVCGTCAGDPRDGSGYHAFDCPERTERIPAPVVPSDDAPRREQYATSDDYRAAMVEWALSAPPTPSQDAEGDGWWVDSYCNKHDGYHLQHGDDGTDYVLKSIESANEACRALNEQESTIHEPYEALVKAAQRIKVARTFDLGWRGEGAAPRWLEVPASDWDEFIAALTRIEES